MMILMFDRKATDPAVPTRAMPGKRAQGRSSKAAGLRVSGSCLTEPSTLASSFQSGTLLETLSATSAECPIYWCQSNPKPNLVDLSVALDPRGPVALHRSYPLPGTASLNHPALLPRLPELMLNP